MGLAARLWCRQRLGHGNLWAEHQERLAAKRDIPELIKALRQPKDENVRGNVALALDKIGDARAVEPLVATPAARLSPTP